MKKFLLASFLAICSFTASAGGWFAVAESPSAYGWGLSSSRDGAIFIAITECKKRSHFNHFCTVTRVEYRF